jgi:uncharacterized membrane protein
MATVAERDKATAIIHLYRAEVGRLTAYRVRLDTTTHWALGAVTVSLTWVFGEASVPNHAALLPAVLVVLFWWTESRRYRYFELVRQRVRWIERGFLTAVLDGAPDDAQDALRESLRAPEPPLGMRDALAVRLRRHYFWLFALVVAIWLIKLAMHGRGGFVEAARAGPVPGAAVLSVVGAVLALFAIAAARAPETDAE